MVHVNTAGLCGGNAACGDPKGNVACDENAVTCPRCLDIIQHYYDHHRADDDGMAQAS